MQISDGGVLLEHQGLFHSVLYLASSLARFAHIPYSDNCHFSHRKKKHDNNDISPNVKRMMITKLKSKIIFHFQSLS